MGGVSTSWGSSRSNGRRDGQPVRGARFDSVRDGWLDRLDGQGRLDSGISRRRERAEGRERSTSAEA
jgi:hypothetical protein